MSKTRKRQKRRNGREGGTEGENYKLKEGRSNERAICRMEFITIANMNYGIVVLEDIK